MKLICPLVGFTLVSMASLVKADWFANFFDGQWIDSLAAPPSPNLADFQFR